MLLSGGGLGGKEREYDVESQFMLRQTDTAESCGRSHMDLDDLNTEVLWRHLDLQNKCTTGDIIFCYIRKCTNTKERITGCLELPFFYFLNNDLFMLTCCCTYINDFAYL